jgi:hypothetical protein
MPEPAAPRPALLASTRAAPGTTPHAARRVTGREHSAPRPPEVRALRDLGPLVTPPSPADHDCSCWGRRPERAWQPPASARRSPTPSASRRPLRTITVTTATPVFSCTFSRTTCPWDSVLIGCSSPASSSRALRSERSTRTPSPGRQVSTGTPAPASSGTSGESTARPLIRAHQHGGHRLPVRGRRCLRPRRRLHLRARHTRRPGGGHPRAQRDGTTGNRIRPEPVSRFHPLAGKARRAFARGRLVRRPVRLCENTDGTLLRSARSSADVG